MSVKDLAVLLALVTGDGSIRSSSGETLYNCRNGVITERSGAPVGRIRNLAFNDEVGRPVSYLARTTSGYEHRNMHGRLLGVVMLRSGGGFDYIVNGRVVGCSDGRAFRINGNVNHLGH